MNSKVKRNANGAGSFSRRENSWIYTISIGKDNQGKYRRKSFGAKTQKEAKAKADRYLKDRHGGIDIDEKVPFSVWIDLWFENHKENISATTAEGYKYTIRLLKSYFGIRPINEIRVMDVDRYLIELKQEGRSDSYRRKCRAMLFQVMQKAEANDLIRKNPVQFANKIKSDRKASKRDAFTAMEVKLMIEHLPHDRIGAGIRLLLGTGMRTQELLALEPRYIAEDGSVIYVRQALKLVKGTPVIGEPKTENSYRDIPVPVGLRAYARMLRDTDKKFILEAGVEGQPCNPTYFRDQFRKYLEDIPGVRLLTPHCCRHTYVSQMQAAGVDMATIQALVGHSDLDMTLGYLHVQDPAILKAVDRYDNTFFREEEDVMCDAEPIWMLRYSRFGQLFQATYN